MQPETHRWLQPQLHPCIDVPVMRPMVVRPVLDGKAHEVLVVLLQGLLIKHKKIFFSW
jgi:hypothetical protein